MEPRRTGAALMAPSAKTVLAIDPRSILRNVLRNVVTIPVVETETRKIIARLRREGCINVGGAKHDKFEHPDRLDILMVVPRRRQSPGVARSIAKLAGWI